MIMMMTDPDRVALSAFPACILVSFHSPPIHANFNALHLPLECPLLQFVTHLITPSDPPLSVSHRSKFVRFLLVNNLATPDPPRLFPFICAAPLSRSSTSFAPKQPTITQKTCNQSHSAHLPSFFASQHAYTHLRSIIYVSITRGGIYLAPKRRICRGREAPEHQKTPFVVSNTLS
jgi:hypothetical protein